MFSPVFMIHISHLQLEGSAWSDEGDEEQYLTQLTSHEGMAFLLISMISKIIGLLDYATVHQMKLSVRKAAQ